MVFSPYNVIAEGWKNGINITGGILEAGLVAGYGHGDLGAGKVVRANHIKPSSPCTDDDPVSDGGEVSTQSGSYYFEDYAGYVDSNGNCLYNAGILRGPFSVSGNSCNKIPWCVQNGYCQ